MTSRKMFMISEGEPMKWKKSSKWHYQNFIKIM